MSFGSLSVVGLGYIGLPTSVVFASGGLRVFGVDTNADHVAAINAGVAPFVEPALEEGIRMAVTGGLMTASEQPHAADATIIAVPTPFLADKTADLSYVQAAAKEIAHVLSPGNLVVLESTSPPGTTEKLRDWIVQANPSLIDSEGVLMIDLAHAPERVLPGKALAELVTNDRIVGGLTSRASQRAKELYSIVCSGSILETDARTAEMVKCVENSFRDMNIAFANELSRICDHLSIDVWEVITLANHHPRVNILNPGPGVGGHCLAVDPWFLVQAAPKQARLIKLARQINDSQPSRVVRKVRKAVRHKKAPTILVLGLAFKANIDDLRESPAIEVTRMLAAEFPTGRILAVEPNIIALPKMLSELPNVALIEYADASAGADVIVLLVDHDEFRAKPVWCDDTPVVDTRGVWHHNQMANYG